MLRRRPLITGAHSVLKCIQTAGERSLPMRVRPWEQGPAPIDFRWDRSPMCLVHRVIICECVEGSPLVGGVLACVRCYFLGWAAARPAGYWRSTGMLVQAVACVEGQTRTNRTGEG